MHSPRKHIASPTARKIFAGMVELVDSVDLGSTAKSVQVRVLLPAPKNDKFQQKLVVFTFSR